MNETTANLDGTTPSPQKIAIDNALNMALRGAGKRKLVAYLTSENVDAADATAHTLLHQAERIEHTTGWYHMRKKRRVGYSTVSLGALAVLVGLLVLATTGAIGSTIGPFSSGAILIRLGTTEIDDNPLFVPSHPSQGPSNR